MNLLAWTLLVIIVVVPPLYAVWLVWRHYRTKRADYRALQEAARPRIDWAEKVMAAETDEAVLLLEKPPFRWPKRVIFPAVVAKAEAKTEEALVRRRRLLYDQITHNMFADAVELEQLAERMEPYLDIWKRLVKQRSDDEANAMRARITEDALRYAANLLESARAGHRQLFIDLVAFITPSSTYDKSIYRRLVDAPYKAPRDWDDLVVRYYKTPELSIFRGEYNVQEPGRLRLLAARALREESLLLAQVVLAHLDSHKTSRDRWRQEVGSLAADLGRLVERLQVERMLNFI